MKRLYRFGALCVLALRVSTDATGLAYWVAARWIGTIDAMHFLGVAVLNHPFGEMSHSHGFLFATKFAHQGFAVLICTFFALATIPWFNNRTVHCSCPLFVFSFLHVLLPIPNLLASVALPKHVCQKLGFAPCCFCTLTYRIHFVVGLPWGLSAQDFQQ